MKEVQGDKRGLERFDLEIPARIRISKADNMEKTLDFLTSDICSGGAFFNTPRPLAVGTDVIIDLILPISKLIRRLEKLEENYQQTRINVSGTVLRSESGGMAISFNNDYEIGPWQEMVSGP
jgi:hypothetical protein